MLTTSQRNHNGMTSALFQAQRPEPPATAFRPKNSLPSACDLPPQVPSRFARRQIERVARPQQASAELKSAVSISQGRPISRRQPYEISRILPTRQKTRSASPSLESHASERYSDTPTYPTYERPAPAPRLSRQHRAGRSQEGRQRGKERAHQGRLETINLDTALSLPAKWSTPKLPIFV